MSSFTTSARPPKIILKWIQMKGIFLRKKDPMLALCAVKIFFIVMMKKKEIFSLFCAGPL